MSRLWTKRTAITASIIGTWLIASLTPSLSRADSAGEAAQILQYFSAGCPTQASWTQTALSYANDLVTVFQTIAADPDCKTMNGALTEVQTLSTVLTSLQENQDQRQLASLKQQEQELLLLISQASDPSQTSDLVDQLQSVEVQLAELQAQAPLDGAYQTQQARGDALQTLVSGTNILLQQAVQNQNCIQKKGAMSVLSGIAGLAGSVSAVALTGGQSLLVAASADMINTVIEAAHQFHLSRRINKMASAITASAYQCALEALSNQWCSADDALRIVKIQGDSITAPSGNPGPTPLQSGIALLNLHSPLFLSWLDSVRSGTDPSTEATAALQAAVLDRDKQVRAGRVIGLGLIAQSEQLFSQTPKRDDQWAIELQTISSLVSAFTSSSCTNGPCGGTPFSDVFSADAYDVGAWFLVGVSDANIPRDPNTGARKPLNSFTLEQMPALTGNSNFKPDLDFVKTNMNAWVSKARDRVNTEMGLVLNLDPLKLLINAITPDLNGNSPYKSLQSIIAFMTSQRNSIAGTGSLVKLYDDTLTRLQAISDDIEATVPAVKEASTGDLDPIHTLADISKQAVLDNGTGFLSDRITWAIRLSLNQLLVSGGSGLSTADAAALIAQNDIVSELQSYTSSAEVNLIARDAANSEVIVEKTLENFTDEFGKGIKRALEDYAEQAKDLREDASGTSNQAAAELCLKLLASPKWPHKVPRKLCLGRSLNSVFKNGPSSATITDALIDSQFKERVCQFRDYNRANRLYQQFLGRRSSASPASKLR